MEFTFEKNQNIKCKVFLLSPIKCATGLLLFIFHSYFVVISSSSFQTKWKSIATFKNVSTHVDDIFFYIVLAYINKEKKTKKYKIIDDKWWSVLWLNCLMDVTIWIAFRLRTYYHYYSYYCTLTKLTVICGYFVSGQQVWLNGHQNHNYHFKRHYIY